MKNIAVCHYTTKHGTDTILFRTNKMDLSQLPEITNELLAGAGVEDVDLDNDEEREEAEWYNLLPLDQLPTV